MHRPRFSLKTMLWLVAVVAAFFGGIEWHKAQLKRVRDAADRDFTARTGIDIAAWRRLVDQHRAKRGIGPAPECPLCGAR
jgi:hypothetical protein